MAKIAYSALVSGVRNKVGTNVFSKGRFGPIVRIRVSPTQPRTAAQNAVRANFTTNSKAWDALTQAQRNAWIALAASAPQKDIFGNTYFMTGLQLYQAINRNLDTIAIAAIPDPPADLVVGAPGALTAASAAGPPITLTLTPTTAAGANEVPTIYGAAPLKAGRLFVGNRYRYIGKMAAAAAGPWDIAAMYAAKFGALAAGQNVNLAARYIDNAKGAASLLTTVQITIA